MTASAPIDKAEIPDVAIEWYRSLPWWRFLSHSITIAWRFSHLLVGCCWRLADGLGMGSDQLLFWWTDSCI